MTPTNPEIETEKKSDDAVTLVPVPDEDIIKFAKEKCSLCLGLGKLKVTAVGGDDPKTLVCHCATKRFIAANSKLLAVSRDKKLFYREVPDGVATPADEVVEETPEAETDEGRVTARFKVMTDRVTIIDKELTEIGERYARQMEPLTKGVAEAEAALSIVKSDYKFLANERDELAAKISRRQAELDELVKTEKELRSELDRDKQSLAEAETDLSAENIRLYPFHEAVLQAKGKVDDLCKRQHQAMRPSEQRKASLLKRMDHKAASLGTTVEIVLKQSLNEKYGKAQ